ncbi:MAG: hypothetical protein OEZ34_06155 [Spirochaetia bacterium]|nr:hypothetical protein [Spirochaetia bacterium]
MSVLKISVIVVMFLLSVLFIPGFFAIGDKARGLKIHKEMPPHASLNIVNVKGMITGVVGVLFILAAVGLILNNSYLVLFGVGASILFVLFYFYEIVLWGRSYPVVIGGFLMFGLPVFLLGLYCLSVFRSSMN